MENRIADLDDQLIHQTKKYVECMLRREQRMYDKLCRKDSAAATEVFAGSIDRYNALEKQLAGYKLSDGSIISCTNGTIGRRVGS